VPRRRAAPRRATLPRRPDAAGWAAVACDDEAELDRLVGETGSLKTGALQRSLELEAELLARGVSFELLDDTPQCALLASARRAYKSFVLPRSPAALKVAMGPTRAAFVAVEVQKLVDVALAQRAAWEERCRAEVEGSLSAPRLPLVLVLDGLRSTSNVASLLRTCAAAGVQEVLACGITPSPPDPAVLRFAPEPEAATALRRVPVRQVGSTREAVEDLRRRGFAVWALETTSSAVHLGDVDPPRPLALVLGHETQGVSVEVLNACDLHVAIPMRGMKNSLNVAVAGAIAVFDVVRRWG